MEADALVVAESLALGLVAIIVGILAALALAMVIYAYAVTETRPDPIALPRDRAGLLELYEQACRIEGQSGGGLVAAVVEGVGRDFDAPRLRKALAALQAEVDACVQQRVAQARDGQTPDGCMRRYLARIQQLYHHKPDRREYDFLYGVPS